MTRVDATPTSSVQIFTVVDEGLGHSSYIVALGDGTALVVTGW